MSDVVSDDPRPYRVYLRSGHYVDIALHASEFVRLTEELKRTQFSGLAEFKAVPGSPFDRLVNLNAVEAVVPR